MTISEEIQPLSDRPAHHCAVCGARVSDTATTCLICGADLTDQQEVEEAPSTPKRKFSFPRILILVIIAFLILTGSVIIGLKLGESNTSAELPTFTTTPTLTPTITPSPTVVPISTATPLSNTPTPQPPEEYVVQEGDTPGGIAEKYGLSLTDLLTFNDLSAEDFIVLGQTLLIPRSPPTPGPSPTLRPGEPTATQSLFLLHTVRDGDALSTIAEKYGVPVAEIKTANDIPLDSDAIRLGQVLTIPMQTPTPAPTPDVIVTPTPTPGIVSYVAPLMLYPPNKVTIIGKDSPIALQWVSVGILNEREYYNVEVIISIDDEKTTHNTYVRSTVFRIPQDWLAAEDVNTFTGSWRVHIVRQVLGNDAAKYKIISTTVARRNFTWISE